MIGHTLDIRQWESKLGGSRLPNSTVVIGKQDESMTLLIAVRTFQFQTSAADCRYPLKIESRTNRVVSDVSISQGS